MPGPHRSMLVTLERGRWMVPPDPPEPTLDLARLREGWDFEAKLAAGRDGRGTVPPSFFETYAAMANSEGGTIVLGALERSDGGFNVAGLSDVARVEQDLWHVLDNRQKVSANVLGRRDVTVARLNGRDVLVVRVPRAPRTVRPFFLAGNPMNAFHRSGQGDRRRTEPGVRRMIADACDPVGSATDPVGAASERDTDPVGAASERDTDPVLLSFKNRAFPLISA